jgi:UDP-4-amino-4,6-dideoxy-N-acetyl-beta-L-altrosamine N-acetyltransferase
MLGPTLRGDLITLQPAEVADLDTFRRWFADLEITRFLLARFVPSEQQEIDWYARMCAAQDTVHWKIVREGRTIGVTALHDVDYLNGSATSGTIIGDRSQHGHGFGTEVVRLRTGYAFDELNLQRLETESLAENIPMHRCLEKSGYVKIGRRRRRIYRGGAWHDAFIFELLREEWEERESQAGQ